MESFLVAPLVILAILMIVALLRLLFLSFDATHISRDYVSSAANDLRDAIKERGCSGLVRRFVERHRHSQEWPSHELILLCQLLSQHDVSTTPTVLSRLLILERDEMQYEKFCLQMDSTGPESLAAATESYVTTYADQLDNRLDGFVRYALERWPDDASPSSVSELVMETANRVRLARFARALDCDGAINMTIADVDVMSGYEFEAFLIRLYTAMGYEACQTQLSRDQGADLVLTRLGERTVVQAKRLSSKVSNKAVQEIVSARAQYEATRAVVVSSNTFTPAAIQLARSNQVELVDREALERLISIYFGSTPSS